MLICVAQVLHRYAPVWGCDAASFLKLRPCFLGGVMGATGNKPPIAVAPKGVYTYKDFFRNAKHFDIPMAMPPKFPANTIQGVCSLSNVCCTTPGQPPSTHDRLPCECKSSNACLDSAFRGETGACTPRIAWLVGQLLAEPTGWSAFGCPAPQHAVWCVLVHCVPCGGDLLGPRLLCVWTGYRRSRGAGVGPGHLNRRVR